MDQALLDALAYELSEKIRQFEVEYSVTVDFENECCGCTGGVYIYIEDADGNCTPVRAAG